MVLNDENAKSLVTAIYENSIKDYRLYCERINKILNKRYKNTDDYIRLDTYRYQIKLIDKFFISGNYQFDIDFGIYIKESLQKLLKKENRRVYDFIYGGLNYGISNKKNNKKH